MNHSYKRPSGPSFYRQLLVSIVTASLGIMCSSAAAHAQLFGDKQEEVDLDNSLVPQSAFAVFTLHPQELVKNPKLSFIPKEVITAAGIQNIGFDPMLIEQATVVVAEPPNGMAESGPPRWVVVMRFSELQGLAGNMIQDMEPATIAGKKAYLSPGREYGAPSFLIYDESTIVFGDSRYFETMLAEGAGNIAKLMENRKVNGQVMGFIDMESLRPSVNKMTAGLKSFGAMEDLKDLPNLIQSISIGNDSSKRVTTKIVMQANNANDAEVAREIILKSLKYLHAVLISEMQKQMDLEDPVQVATIAYADRIWNKFEPKMIPEVNGTTMTVTLHEEVFALPLLLGITGQSMGSAIQPKMTPQMKGRQIALGMLNYESAYKRFPPHTIRDENGKALFSGLTAILPFIEQNNISRSLRMDEPWDSEHNLEFSQRPIEVFADVTGDGRIRMPVFPGSIWDTDEGTSLGRVTDGTSNTILLIQAPPNSDQSWADPTPWKISESNPMKDVFGDRDEAVFIMADSSAVVIKKKDMTNEKLKAMLTMNGGEVIER